MFKFSGILDGVQLTLAPGVWTPELRLIPEIQKQIFSILKNIIPLEYVDRALIIGSITGYKYTSESDIDVNVVLKETIPEDEANTLHKKTRIYNGTPAIGGNHPINFFIRPYHPPGNWSNSPFGVYDIFNDNWKKLPLESSESLRNPKDQYITELMAGKMFARRFADMVNDLYIDNLDLEGLTGPMLKRKQEEIENDVRTLLAEEKRIHKERDIPYNSG
ncbi:hypothetical protein H8D85_01605 [bacterium]|nr:hypothetical protein [bacterium]